MSDFGHLQFLQQGESRSKRQRSNNDGFWGEMEDQRSNIEKQADIVDYLRGQRSNAQKSAHEIYNDLKIVLEDADDNVLHMLRRNEKVEVIETDQGEFFRYRTKYNISNKDQLLSLIDSIKMGVSLNDVKHCYLGIESDVMEWIIGGMIIAYKADKDMILYPRGKPFLTPLSGTVKATPGMDTVSTSTDIREEIRRGDAIMINNQWLRVDCAIQTNGKQPERGRPPQSVTSWEERSIRDTQWGSHMKQFTERQLPLDGDFIHSGDGAIDLSIVKNEDGTTNSGIYDGTAYKYGVTNDISRIWRDTARPLKLQGLNHKDGNARLEEELMKHGLVSQAGASEQSKAQVIVKDKQKRAKPRPRRSNAKLTNKHLAGTEVGAILAEARRKAMLPTK